MADPSRRLRLTMRKTWEVRICVVSVQYCAYEPVPLPRGGGLGGLSPPNAAPRPPNENMKH